MSYMVFSTFHDSLSRLISSEVWVTVTNPSY